MKDETIVYIVDDDDDDRIFTREAFENVFKAIEVTEFTDGQQLLGALDLNDNVRLPSLILMDINMPRISGLEALSVVRSNPAISHIPVILFSTSSSPSLIQEAYRLGANAYIVKPVSLSGYIQMARAVTLSFLGRAKLSEKTGKKSSFRDKSILIIEDNSDHWNIMRLAMEIQGGVKLARTDRAESAMTFLASSYESQGTLVDLIVLDLYLPGRQQGLDLIEQIRGFFTGKRLAPVPIIIFSGSDHKDDITASYQRRANAYLTKSTDLARSAFQLNEVCQLWSTTIVTPGTGFL